MPAFPRKKTIKSLFENDHGIDWLMYVDTDKKVPNIAEINAMYSKIIAQPMRYCEHLNWIVDQLIEDTYKEDEPCYHVIKPPKREPKVESSDDEIIY